MSSNRRYEVEKDERAYFILHWMAVYSDSAGQWCFEPGRPKDFHNSRERKHRIVRPGRIFYVYTSPHYHDGNIPETDAASLVNALYDGRLRKVTVDLRDWENPVSVTKIDPPL